MTFFPRPKRKTRSKQTNTLTIERLVVPCIRRTLTKNRITDWCVYREGTTSTNFSVEVTPRHKSIRLCVSQDREKETDLERESSDNQVLVANCQPEPSSAVSRWFFGAEPIALQFSQWSSCSRDWGPNWFQHNFGSGLLFEVGGVLLHTIEAIYPVETQTSFVDGRIQMKIYKNHHRWGITRWGDC